MGKSIVGMDIGGSRIRAVEVEGYNKSQPVLVRYGEVTVPVEAIRDGEVIEPNTVAAALRRLWSTAGFKTKDVAMGVGNQKVLVRDLTVPRLPIKQIREALPFQVQDMLPVPVADAILDFYPISEGTGPTGPTISGLLVAAVKATVLANVDAVQLAGLNPVSVDLKPFALSRILTRGSLSTQVVAIIDIGADTTNVVIADRSVPQFVRIIPTGGDALTEALQKRLELNLVDADQVKRTIGVSRTDVPAEQRPALEVIFEVTSALLGSLRNTLSFYSNAHAHAPVQRIVLTGGASYLPGFAQALGEQTHLPVEYGDPSHGLQLGKTMDAALLASRPTDFVVPLGLAIGSAA